MSKQNNIPILKDRLKELEKEFEDLKFQRKQLNLFLFSKRTKEHIGNSIRDNMNDIFCDMTKIKKQIKEQENDMHSRNSR